MTKLHTKTGTSMSNSYVYHSIYMPSSQTLFKEAIINSQREMTWRRHKPKEKHEVSKQIYLEISGKKLAKPQIISDQQIDIRFDTLQDHCTCSTLLMRQKVTGLAGSNTNPSFIGHSTKQVGLHCYSFLK